MLQVLKPLLAFSILLLSASSYAQDDAKAIIKSIPVKKVKSVEQVNHHADWYYFKTKTQVGLWDNVNKKILIDLRDDINIHPTEKENVYVAHGKGYWGVVLESEHASYLVPDTGLDHDTTFFENRYEVSFDDYDNHLYYRDTLLEVNYNMAIDEKFILLNQRDWKAGKTYMLAIRRGDNEVVENYEGWVKKFNGGYIVEESPTERFDYYNSDFKSVMKGKSKAKMELADYKKIIPFELDSIEDAGYQEFLFYAGGKIGMFSWYDGVVMKPEYDMALTAGYYYTVLLKDNKIGLHVNMGGKVIEAEHDILEIISPQGCEEYIRVGDRLFEAVYYDCEIFDHLTEVNFSRYDSVAPNNITSSCKIINNGADMLYNHNVKEYRSIVVGVETSDGFEDETYGDRQVYTRKSGIYNLASKSWDPNRRYHSIIPYGDNFYVITEPAKNIQNCKVFLVDKSFKRNDVYVYEHQKRFNGKLICIDADKNFYWYSDDGKRHHIGKYNNIETQENNGFLLIGEEDYDNYSWEARFRTEAIIDADMQELKVDYTVEKIIENNFAIVGDFDEFGYGSYGVLDMKTGEIVQGWYEYVSYKEGKLLMGNYEEEELQMTPAELRAKLK